jgi:Cft2 family RNA processing exonuclease
MSKRPIEILSNPDSLDLSTLSITPLGAGQEVGRSSVLLKYNGRSVLFDCGIHPAFSGQMALPFFDAAGDLSKIDACLVTHFHLDHSGSLPYLVSKTNFKGRVFMTAPTKPICKLLWVDYSRVSKISAENEHLFEKEDIAVTMDAIEIINYHETKHLPDGLKITAYRAGHVLGACMFLVEIAGLRVLYTGDFSSEIDRHLPAAEIPPSPIHVLIVESTYGTQTHEPRMIREGRFLQAVHDVVKTGGKCLLPVFALGRAQELLLLLEQYWAMHPDLHSTPIFYSTPMANKSLNIYTTYTSLCSPMIIESTNNCHNTWSSFKYIKCLSDCTGVEWEGKVMNPNLACVVLAAPGMLQSGTSRELFEVFCGERRNGVIFTAYSVAGTLAHDLAKEGETVILPDGRALAVRCSLKWISFSAHSDYEQTHRFIQSLQVGHVVLVHGEANLMRRLGVKIREEFPGIGVYTPGNCQEVRIEFNAGETPGIFATYVGDDPEDVEGGAASKPVMNMPRLLVEDDGEEAEDQQEEIVPEMSDAPNVTALKPHVDFHEIAEKVEKSEDGNPLLFVAKGNGERIIVRTNKLNEFTSIYPHLVNFSTKVAVACTSLEPIHKEVKRLFANSVIETGGAMETEEILKISGDTCTVSFVTGEKGKVKVSWFGGPVGDLIADSVIQMLPGITDPVKSKKSPKKESPKKKRALEIQQILEDAVGPVKVLKNGDFEVTVEFDDTVLLVKADGMNTEISVVGTEGPEKSEESLWRVNTMLRGTFGEFEPIRI